jgi:hypothetical protein
MHDSLTKIEKRELRDLAAAAHEIELSEAVISLYGIFQSWHEKQINVFDLNQDIHEFHDGISRDIYKKYVLGDLFFPVAQAVFLGILKRENISSELLNHLEPTIESMARLNDDN